MIAGASGGCLVLRDGKFAGLSCYQRTLSKRILFTKVRWAGKLVYWILIAYLIDTVVDMSEAIAAL